jgi:hypothetical protein
MHPTIAHYDGSVHPCFAQPASLDTRLWRYMSLAKLVSLLDTRHLHFSRSDTLEDPFEGSWARNQPNRRLMDSFAPTPEIADGRRRAEWEVARQSVAVSCWHLGEYESAAMWNQYGDGGLALQTTFRRLIESLPRKVEGSKGSIPVFVGLVQYIDYEAATIPENNAYWTFMHKRLSPKFPRHGRVSVRFSSQTREIARFVLATSESSGDRWPVSGETWEWW